jgi:putative SOS response-associated peptidase YedK
MCNLYSVRTSRAALARRFMLSDNRMAAFDPLPAIFPGHMAPIIKQSADGERELVMRSWGFILLREGYAPKRVTNTREARHEHARRQGRHQILEGQLRVQALPGAGDGILRARRRQTRAVALVCAEG